VTIAITGGTGFIGSHLARAIPEAVLFDYPKHDLRNIADACAFIDEYEPEVVYHLAAQSVVTNDDDLVTLDTNIVGTYNLLHACRNVTNLRAFIHISTDKVYGCNGEAKTTDPLKGINDSYTVSKTSGDILAQMYAKHYGLPVRIVRMANIYGPGDTHFDRIVPGTIMDTLQGKARRHRGDHRFIRDYIYIDDLIPAYLRIPNEPPGIYNLGGEFCSVSELVQTILRLMGREDLQPVWENTQHNEITMQHIEGCPDWWKPQTSLEEGLLKTIEYYRRFEDGIDPDGGDVK
jgi:CDP-glucose 4,6-dehydratase